MTTREHPLLCHDDMSKLLPLPRVLLSSSVANSLIITIVLNNNASPPPINSVEGGRPSHKCKEASAEVKYSV